MELKSFANERAAPTESNQDVFEIGEAKPEVKGAVVVDGDELMMPEEFQHFYGDAGEEKRDALADSRYYWPGGK